MADKRKRTRIDPELTRQLDEASPADRSVQAVVYLRSSHTGTPDSVSREASKVIEAATAKAGTGPGKVNVLRNLGTIAVEAPASFVRALIDEADVESALANVQPDADAGMGVPSAHAEDEAGDADYEAEAEADEADGPV